METSRKHQLRRVLEHAGRVELNLDQETLRDLRESERREVMQPAEDEEGGHAELLS